MKIMGLEPVYTLTLVDGESTSMVVGLLNYLRWVFTNIGPAIDREQEKRCAGSISDETILSWAKEIPGSTVANCAKIIENLRHAQHGRHSDCVQMRMRTAA